MTTFTGVKRADAQEMVAKGGRILKHYRDAEGAPVCDVETLNNGDAGQPPPPPPPVEVEAEPEKSDE